MRVSIELVELTVEGEVVSGDPLCDGSADFDLDSTFVVRCDDGTRFTIHGWMVDVVELPSTHQAAF